MSYAEMEALAENLSAGGQIEPEHVARLQHLGSSGTCQLDAAQQRLVGRAALDLTATRREEWDTLVAQQQKLIHYKPLRELIRGLNEAPPEAAVPTAPAAGDGPEPLAHRVELTDEDSSHTSFSTSSDSESEEEWERRRTASAVNRSTKTVESSVSADTLRSYQDWLLAVAQQRQYIQKYEYWRYVNYYFSQK
jgi:hypothetical protein